MKFKQYISDTKIDNVIIVESLDTLDEVDSTVIKLKTLYNISDHIHDLDLANVFTDIRLFMKTKTSDMRVSELKEWGSNIIKELENNIKILLDIKTTIKTKYLDSLIIQSNKLVNNIRRRINHNKEAYDKASS